MPGIFQKPIVANEKSCSPRPAPMRIRRNIESTFPSASPQPSRKNANDRRIGKPKADVARLQAENQSLHKLQQQVESARNRLALFHRHSPVAHIIFDSKGQIIDLNAAAAKLVGKRSEGLLRTSFQSLLAESDGEIFHNHLRRCRFAKTKRVVSELHLHNRNRKPINVQILSVRFCHEGQTLFLSALIDLTERIKNESSLEQSKEFAESIIETVQEPLIVLDSDLKVVSVNQAFSEVFRKPANQAKGRSFDVLLDLWWAGNKVREALQRILLERVSLNNFELIVQPEGIGERIFLLNARPLERRNTPMQILVALQDITGERKINERLKISESMLSEAQRIAHLGSWEWSVQEDKVVWSDELYRIFGIEPKKFKATYAAFLECVHRADRQTVNNIVQTAYRNKSSFDFYHRTSAVDSPRVLHCQGYAVSDVNGQALKIVGTAQDVTDIKEAEERLNRLNEELEQRVRNRTNALQQSNRQMEAFCYSIAHDLRSPLRAMKGFGHALMEDYRETVDTQGKEYIDRIVNAADRMDLLIQDLLDYGRLNTIDLPIGEVDAETILRDVISQLESEIKASGGIIVHRERLPKIIAHDLVLQVGFTNVLSNALKFVGPGVKPKIEIWPEARHENVRIWIQDNGIGIDEQYQKKIFEVFQRLHTTEKYPGTGIGLAIVAKGVERIGGHVGVESTPGKGSRFWIELPKA